MRFALVIALVLMTGHKAMAEDMDTVKEYRQGTYTAIGGHMTAIVNIVRNQFRPADLRYHATALRDLSRIVPELFPEGSGGGDTEALPKIWEQPEAFDERMQTFVEAAGNMAEVSDSGDMRRVAGALQELGRACKGCHDNFRAD